MTDQPREPFIPAESASAAARLPAIIDQLPPDSAHPAQTGFTRARQAAFLHRLADCGEVRVAAGNSNVSHQTVYRMRRSCPTFRLGWDAALVIARERAEDMLASRALHGVEEAVFYHGEEVARRRRYDSRLLLAHLARLDRMAEREDVAALAGAFDDVIAAFEAAGEDSEPVLPEAGGGEGKRSPGPCNMRSMSRAMSRAGGAGEADDEAGHEVPNEGADQGADEPMDADTEADPDAAPAMEDRLCAMEAARPGDAPSLHAFAAMLEAREVNIGEVNAGEIDVGEIEAAQLDAFEAGEAEWWLALPPSLSLSPSPSPSPSPSAKASDGAGWSGAGSGATAPGAMRPEGGDQRPISSSSTRA